ncbi:MAG TPA: hypothetical protein VKU41_15860 [Polyangiaceae bacterium]|nr:hypothetical protein [Polyangiaceae bacterium]
MKFGVAVSVVLALSCGYRAEYAEPAGSRLHVALVRTLVPDVVAAEEVAAGARDELARAGALASGEGYPRVEIEVLGAEEHSEGVTAGAGRGPVARATDAGLVARAWIVRGPDARPENDTGDLRADTAFAVDEANGGPDPRAAGFHYADGLRAAARRLGHYVAQRVRGGAALGDAPVDLR